MRINKILFVAIAILLFSMPVYSQVTLKEVLESVEQNNLKLQALRHETEGKSLEARMSNNMDDLSVSYGHLWGDPVNEYGKTGELEITQSFDFPTAYIHRNRIASNLARQYGNDFVAARQQLLLEAKQTYFELQTALKMQQLLDYRSESNKRLSDLYAEKYDNGDVSILEKSKMEHEYLLFQETVTENRIKIMQLEKKLANLNGGQDILVRLINEPLEDLSPYHKVAEDYMEKYPALNALRLQEEEAEYNLKLSRSQSLPKFEIGYKHEYSVGAERFNGVIVGMSIPIFSNRHNVKQAKAFQQAVRIEGKAAEIECATLLGELYEKASLLHLSLANYKNIDMDGNYLKLLSTALEAGAISVVEYFSEIYSYYDVISSRLRLELEYRLIVSEINMIYL